MILGPASALHASDTALSFPSGFMQKTDHHIEKVEDKWIFIFVYPIMALLVVHLGNDNSLQDLVEIPSYYSDLLLALFCTFGIGFYFRWLFFRIGETFTWDDQMGRRLIFQLIPGVLFPIVVSVSIESVYLVYFLEIPLAESSIFYLELPLIAVFCVFINMLYILLFFRRANRKLATRVEEMDTTKEEFGDEKPADSKANFVVHSGYKAMKIPIAEIAHIHVYEKAAFLTTNEGKQFLDGSSLSELRSELPSKTFYQLNRQVIANRNAVLAFEQTETRKLKIDLDPPLDHEVFVSKKRSAEFVRWMNEK